MTEYEAIQDSWTEIAPRYDEHVTPPNMALADGALQRAGLQPGMQVLDVAAGTGGLSIPAARAGAQVVATDISPAMVERLEMRARDEGLTNLTASVMDGHALDLEDDSFDIAASQFGVMLFADLPRGLRELTRVTRPGGHVVLITLGPPSEIEFLTVFLEAATAVDPEFAGLPMDPLPVPFQVSAPETLRAELATAGLTDIRLETVNHRLEFGSGRQLWDWVTGSNPIGADMVADLSAEQTKMVQQALDEELRERADGTGPAVLNNTVNIGIGTKRPDPSIRDE